MLHSANRLKYPDCNSNIDNAMSSGYFKDVRILGIYMDRTVVYLSYMLFVAKFIKPGANYFDAKVHSFIGTFKWQLAHLNQ